MVKLEILQEKVKVLKSKISESKKNKDKSKPEELRSFHKNLKRAQRKIRIMNGKKLAALTGAKKEEGTATPAQPAPAAKPAGEKKV
ncbi:MAG: hypothetical protein HY811_04395 [Planctomycetes bacterium]|nr:hypothetical protein [Planctomycetota bacterium]